MQEDPFRNKFICIINEQTNNCVSNPHTMTFKKGYWDKVRTNRVKAEMNIPMRINC